jgi:septum formation protein
MNTTNRRIILASASEIRAQMLSNAGLSVEIMPASIDEEAIRLGLQAENASPRDQVDILAGAKARKISDRYADALVIGSDQILELDGKVFAKPANLDEARDQLLALKGQTHKLLSAVVIYENGQPLWRHIGQVRLTMNDFSSDYLESYLTRNWSSIRHAVGCYKLEEEGVRLFSRIEGDYFTVLGLPLIELLTWLGIRGDIAT